jgi:ribonuclease HII
LKLDIEHLQQATIAQIEIFLKQRGGAGRTILALLEQDERSGVRQLAVRERHRLRQREKEQRRLRRIRHHEEGLWQSGVVHIAGVDEVGRGCLAGPVVAAAVILPAGARLPGVDDSKVLDVSAREDLRQLIEATALAWHVGVVSATRIDRINILEASLEAMRVALDGLAPSPQHVLVDGNRSPGSDYPETLLVDGDARSMSIAAASIVAKQHRDALMVRLDMMHPGYDLASNKGYASPNHRQALTQIGPCAEHRFSFSPLSDRDPLWPGTGEPAPSVPDTGGTGEDRAVEYLQARGYIIDDRRYRAAGGEIDIVARQGACWVFVEVKTTSVGEGGSRPEARLSRAQRQRLIRVARHFLRFRTRDGECRFDVVSVDLSQAADSVEHWTDAFTVDD